MKKNNIMKIIVAIGMLSVIGIMVFQVMTLNEIKETQNKIEKKISFVKTEVFNVKSKDKVYEVISNFSNEDNEAKQNAVWIANGTISSLEILVNEEQTSSEAKELCNEFIQYSPYESQCTEIKDKEQIKGFKFEIKDEK